MSTLRIGGLLVMAAAAWGAGCGSSQDERVGDLEKRVAALEKQLSQVKPGAPPETSKASPAGMPAAASHSSWKGVSLDPSVEKGLKWLVAAQGADGGWGQDGGNEGDARQGVSLETTGNDVANTAVVCLALLRAGHTPKEGAHKDELVKGIKFILSHVEEASAEGLAITKRTGTQIQRKLGPFIDTFLATMVLSEVEGQIPDEALAKRVRGDLEKCVAKVEKNQGKDGSWNAGGGWAPIIGTSIASRGLYRAQEKGVQVDVMSLRKVDDYTKSNFDADKKAFKGDSAAGVELYAAAQALEQASRTAAAAPVPAATTGSGGIIAGRPASAGAGFTAGEAESVTSAAKAKLMDTRFVSGFGSMGGEEFVSYLNISDSLLRAGGKEWTQWNGKIKEHLVKLQNQDGTWAGHHCITGRVACTSAAVMTILAERTSPRIE